MPRLSRHIITIAFFFLFQTLVGQERSDAVTFSQQGGFYDESFELMLMCSSENHIRYTINGATPDSTSTLYTGPLFLSESLYSKSNIYTIVNTIPSTFYLPDDVERIITIRAAVFDANENKVGDTKTNSYIIKQLGYDTHGLPFISITTDSLNLFDYETGIFVPGASYDLSDTTHTGNFHLTGKEWERRINLEFYETDNSGINQQCGLRTHGGASRFFQQKGMRFYAREEYGKKRFKHKFFTYSQIESFKHLNLHPFRCSNWLQTGGQEYMSQRLASEMYVDALSVREVVVFINGEYWGIYTLEESPDERYLEDHYNVNLDEVNVLKYWGVPQYGSNSEWWDFRTWISEAQLSNADDEAYAFSVIDTDNFTDYILLETFGANLDWPQNNVLQWQASNGLPFRWIFFDGDGCLTRLSYNATEHALNSGGNSLIIKKMLESHNYRVMLVNRYYALRNTLFSYQHLKTYLDEYRELTEGEILHQSQRFGFPANYNKWLTDMNTCELFMRDRTIKYNDEIISIAGINEEEINFSITPNPSNGTFTVLLDNNDMVILPVEIYDYTGRKVYSETHVFNDVSNHFTVTTGLSSGLYVIRINNKTQKIAIE